ncbi:MAG: tetratricopeptide repeat protein [Betaproteobacteria bacterium]|nr:MAG: tetratricopeptide repeat protein [Betaproteobacteria bacterium]
MRPVSPLAGPAGDAATQSLHAALAAYQRGELAEAERLCRGVLSAVQSCFEALYLLGIIAGQSGRTEEAAAFLSRAVLVNPTSADAHYNRGVALGELGRHADALQSYEHAIALRSDYADSYYNRGVALAALERLEEAVASYERAIAIAPDHTEAHNNRGVALARLRRYEESLKSCQRAIELRPSYASAHNNCGVALGCLGRLPEALASYDRAIALKPDYADAYNNRGEVLRDLERPAEALASYERAIALKPDYADAYYNRGNALRDLHRHRDAMESYERAIALEPDHASAHWNLADCRLLLGDFPLGWKEYEWRWQLKRGGDSGRNFVQPLWLGATPLEGKTVLLHSELGLGDTLQFCRYAKDVAALGAQVVMEVQPPLLRLLADLDGVAQVVPRGGSLPPFDYHCPLMSLALAFRTNLDSVPARIPYIRSDPASVRVWIERLGERSKPRVGLAWSGSKTLKNDKRSMTLAEMLPLVREWAEWISLQKEVRETDTALLASRPDLRRVDGDLGDFADTASLIELVDIVVTVDTSVAHLAGAMGKPVWILLPFNPHDWRWLLGREDSPWYPTARLFRQSAVDDWTNLVRRVDKELMREFGALIP